MNLYSEKYDLIGKKAAGDCSVRLEIQIDTHRFMQGSMDSKVSLSHLIHCYVLAPSRLKHAFRQNAGHYECSADFMNNDEHRWVVIVSCKREEKP